MKTFRFRDFVIYNEARQFRRIVRKELNMFPKEEKFRLIDQIHRSSLSILLNIAEGSAKGSDKEFARFLEISIASLNEVIAGFDAACDDGYTTLQKSHQIEKSGEQLAKQIGSFIQRLRKAPTFLSHKPQATSQ